MLNDKSNARRSHSTKTADNYFRRGSDKQRKKSLAGKTILHFQRKSTVNISEMEVLLLIEEIKKKQQSGTDYSFTELLVINDTAFETVFFILRKIIRNQYEMLILKIYLNTLGNFMKIIRMNKFSADCDELLSKIALQIKGERKIANSILFRYGDKGDKFYVILKGKVSILIVKEQKMRMCEEDYLSFLTTLKKYSENELYNRVVLANRHIYFSREIELDNSLNNLSSNDLPVKIGNVKQGSSLIFSQDYFKNKNLSPGMNETSRITVEEYIQRIFPKQSKMSLEHQYPELSLFTYAQVNTLGNGDTFGEVALQNNNQKRTATVISIEDCFLGTMTKDVYNNCMKDAQEKFRKGNINFLVSTQIFEHISREAFEKKYFNCFRPVQVHQGEVLITQNEDSNVIYFIKEGEFDIFTKQSMKELNSIITKLGGKVDDWNDKNSASQCYDFPKFYNQSQHKFRISIVKDKEILGLDDYVYKDKYFCTAICLSQTAETYGLEKKFLTSMRSLDERINNNVNKYLETKNKMMIERLLNVKRVNVLNYVTKEKRNTVMMNRHMVNKPIPHPNFIKNYYHPSHFRNCNNQAISVSADRDRLIGQHCLTTGLSQDKDSDGIAVQFKKQLNTTNTTSIEPDNPGLNNNHLIEPRERFSKEKEKVIEKEICISPKYCIKPDDEGISVDDEKIYLTTDVKSNTQTKFTNDVNKLPSSFYSSSKNIFLMGNRNFEPRITKKVLIPKLISIDGNTRRDQLINVPVNLKKKQIQEIRTKIIGSNLPSRIQTSPKHQKVITNIVGKIVEGSCIRQSSHTPKKEKSSLKIGFVDFLAVDKLVESMIDDKQEEGTSSSICVKPYMNLQYMKNCKKKLVNAYSLKMKESVYKAKMLNKSVRDHWEIIDQRIKIEKM